MKLALSVLFCAAISAGVGFIYWPAALVVGGALGLAGLYVYQYLGVGRL